MKLGFMLGQYPGLFISMIIIIDAHTQSGFCLGFRHPPVSNIIVLDTEQCLEIICTNLDEHGGFFYTFTWYI